MSMAGNHFGPVGQSNAPAGAYTSGVYSGTGQTTYHYVVTHPDGTPHYFVSDTRAYGDMMAHPGSGMVTVAAPLPAGVTPED